MEAGFRRWVIANFSELKDHVLTQCKETKNLEERLDKMLTRITSLEKNTNDGAEKHNMRNSRSITQVSIAKLIKQKK